MLLNCCERYGKVLHHRFQSMLVQQLVLSSGMPNIDVHAVDLAFSPNGTILTADSEDLAIVHWRTKEDKQSGAVQGYNSMFATDDSFSPNVVYLVSGVWGEWIIF